MAARVLRKRWLLLTAALIAAVGPNLASAQTPPAPGDAAAPKPARFETLAPLLVLAMDEARWSDPAQSERIEASLSRLAEAAPLLGRHATTRDFAFREVGPALARDAARTRDLHGRQAFEEARASTVEITATCAACHARLPAPPQGPGPALPPNTLDALPLPAQAQVWLALRHFDRALAVWEAAFADEMQSPGQLDMEGYLLDYMTIGLRVAQDPARVRRHFARFAQRPDMPVYLAGHLAGWDLALAAIEKDLAHPAPLDRSRELVAGKGVPRPALLGREQTVYDLVASSLLLQFIEGSAQAPEALAEAYFLLGVVEARSVDSYWLPQAEAHLEAAVRAAPASPAAASAYALLEEYMVVGFGGAGEEALTSEAWETLRDLNLRMQEARTPAENPAAPPP